MSTTVIGWIVIVVNMAICALNTYHMIRLRRLRRKGEAMILEQQQAQRELEQAWLEVDQVQRELEQEHERQAAASADFTRRLLTGDVRVNTDDGRSGALRLVAEGENSLRVTVVPLEPPNKVH